MTKSTDITIKALHAEIDAHGVRQNVAIKTPSRDLGRDAAATLADTKRGKADAYRIAVLALIAQMVTNGDIAPKSLRDRKDYIKAGKPAIMVNAAYMYGDPDKAGDPRWNSNSFVSRFLKDNVHRAGTIKDNVAVVKGDGRHEWWIVLVG
jgi:hypothetical protein